MLLFGKQGRWPSFVLGVLVCVGLAGPSIAGTVYTWKTDEGTISYTDEFKRIPAKYRLSASKVEMGKLKNYPRYTPTGATNVSELERMDSLQGPSSGQSAGVLRTRETGFDGRAVSIGEGGRYGGGTRVQLPIDGSADANGEPIVTDTYRVQPEDSLATRQVRVTRQGDRVIAVDKGQLNQRSWAGTTATGRPEKDVLQ